MQVALNFREFRAFFRVGAGHTSAYRTSWLLTAEPWPTPPSVDNRGGIHQGEMSLILAQRLPKRRFDEASDSAAAGPNTRLSQ